MEIASPQESRRWASCSSIPLWLGFAISLAGFVNPLNLLWLRPQRHWAVGVASFATILCLRRWFRMKREQRRTHDLFILCALLLVSTVYWELFTDPIRDLATLPLGNQTNLVTVFEPFPHDDGTARFELRWNSRLGQRFRKVGNTVAWWEKNPWSEGPYIMLPRTNSEALRYRFDESTRTLLPVDSPS